MVDVDHSVEQGRKKYRRQDPWRTPPKRSSKDEASTTGLLVVGVFGFLLYRYAPPALEWLKSVFAGSVVPFGQAYLGPIALFGALAGAALVAGVLKFTFPFLFALGEVVGGLVVMFQTLTGALSSDAGVTGSLALLAGSGWTLAKGVENTMKSLRAEAEQLEEKSSDQKPKK